MSGSCGKTTVDIHLPKFLGEHVHVVVSVNLFNASFPQIRQFVITSGNGKKVTMFVVRSRDKNVKFF